MRIFLAAFLSLTVLGRAGAQPAAGPEPKPARRIALLIANSAYSQLPAIPGAPAEAKVMASALTGAGFEVTTIENATLARFVELQKDFLAKVQPGDVCVLYYSGYAIQASDDDYLLPVDFKPSVTGNLASRAYPVLVFAKNLELREASLKLIFLEAARRIDANLADAPAPGLLLPDTSDISEVMVALSGGANQLVETPPGQVGRFTQAVADQISKKGSSILVLMPAVLRQVMTASSSQQQPAHAVKITRNFFFHAPEPALGEAHQNRRDREPYVWIPAGKFLMGCVPADEKCQNEGKFKNEKPQHEVAISKGFWMGQNEVRVSSYQRFVALENESAGKNHRKMPDGPFWDKKWKLDDRPISNIRWEDAAAYCAFAGGRLPTEAEWEYAARAGKNNEVYPLNSSNSRDKANFYGQQGNDIFENTAPVRSFDANAFQLFDLSGNVWELVNDLYGETYYAESPAIDPKGPDTGKEHVVRGGSFDSDPKEHLRISIRRHFQGAANATGFRCVLDDSAAARRILQVP